MNCCEFREAYSDFADGLLDESAEVLARRHLAECASCRRFDAAFRTGVGMLREMPVVAPSHGFGADLRRKIRHEAASATPALRRWSGAAGAALIVTVFGIMGWDHRDHAEAGVLQAPSARRQRAIAPTWEIRNSALRLAHDTAFFRDNPFHPIPITTDTYRALYAGQLRFETLAVWTGR